MNTEHKQDVLTCNDDFFTLNWLTVINALTFVVLLYKCSDYDDAILFTIVAPSIPSTCEVSNVTMSSVLISWSPAAGASYYQVSVNDNIIRTVNRTVTSLLVTDLQPGTRYTFTVTVYDSDQQQANTVRAEIVTGNVQSVNQSNLINLLTLMTPNDRWNKIKQKRQQTPGKVPKYRKHTKQKRQLNNRMQKNNTH